MWLAWGCQNIKTVKTEGLSLWKDRKDFLSWILLFSKLKFAFCLQQESLSLKMRRTIIKKSKVYTTEAISPLIAHFMPDMLVNFATKSKAEGKSRQHENQLNIQE